MTKEPTVMPPWLAILMLMGVIYGIPWILTYRPPTSYGYRDDGEYHYRPRRHYDDDDEELLIAADSPSDDTEAVAADPDEEAPSVEDPAAAETGTEPKPNDNQVDLSLPLDVAYKFDEKYEAAKLSEEEGKALARKLIAVVFTERPEDISELEKIPVKEFFAALELDPEKADAESIDVAYVKRLLNARIIDILAPEEPMAEQVEFVFDALANADMLNVRVSKGFVETKLSEFGEPADLSVERVCSLLGDENITVGEALQALTINGIDGFFPTGDWSWGKAFELISPAPEEAEDPTSRETSTSRETMSEDTAEESSQAVLRM